MNASNTIPKSLVEQAQQQNEILQELKLNVAKIAIHGSERVLLSFIERAFAYQETVDSLLIQAITSENGDRIVEVAQIQADVAKKLIETGSERLEQLINVQAARRRTAFSPDDADA